MHPRIRWPATVLLLMVLARSALAFESFISKPGDDTHYCNAVQNKVGFIRYPLGEIGAWSTASGEMADVMTRTAGLRRPGAAALDLAYVAAGFTDGFFETGLSPWDVAAGSLLVTEAGGLIGNFTGEAEFIEQKECVAGNPKIYGQLVNILHKYSKFASAGEKAALRNAPELVDPKTPLSAQIEGPEADGDQ